jgi:hypothetical protein
MQRFSHHGFRSTSKIPLAALHRLAVHAVLPSSTRLAGGIF